MFARFFLYLVRVPALVIYNCALKRGSIPTTSVKFTMKKNKDQRRITLVVGMYFCPCGITWIELEQSPMGIHYLSFACLTFVPAYQRVVPFISYRSNRFWLQKKKFKELLCQKQKKYLMITFHASIHKSHKPETLKNIMLLDAPPSSYIKGSQTLQFERVLI